MIPLEKCTKSELIKIIKTCESAIEKQIPKKPICKKYTIDTKCPVCGTFALIYNKYCIECGQALDWSDTE